MMMSDQTHIKALVKEAECYRSQGLSLASQAAYMEYGRHVRERVLQKRLSLKTAQPVVLALLGIQKTPARFILAREIQQPPLEDSTIHVSPPRPPSMTAAGEETDHLPHHPV